MRCPDTYLGYPHLEAVANDRQNPELKPRWLLRYWYLLDDLPAEADPEQICALWKERLGCDHKSALRALRMGMGLYWERRGGKIRLFNGRELHDRLGLPYRVSRRPYAGLLESTQAYHLTLLEGQLDQVQRDAEGCTDPVSYEELQKRTGFSRSTLKRLFRRSRLYERIDQWRQVLPNYSRESAERLRQLAPKQYFQTLPSLMGLFQRRPNRWRRQVRGPDPEDPVETAGGRELRAGQWKRLLPRRNLHTRQAWAKA